MLFLLLNFDPGSDLFVQGGDRGAHHLLSQCLPCTAVASVGSQLVVLQCVRLVAPTTTGKVYGKYV
jgi:hypothetical protein